MTDTAIGFLIVGAAMLVVLGVVFAVTSRRGPARPRPTPPQGVHLPPGSFLPVVLSIGGALMGAGLAFRPEDQFANLFLLIPGLVIFVGGIVWWVAAANREWREVDAGGGHGTPHDDQPTH
jgi:hypothetical protein